MRYLLCILAGVMLLNTPLYGQNSNRTFREIMEIMEASETMYQIIGLSQLADVDPEDYGSHLFPPLAAHENFPWVEQNENGFQLVQFPIDTVAFQYLVEGEPDFKAKRYDKARKYYLKAIEADDNFYVAYLHLGDTYYFSDELDKALELYNHAISINPYDYRSFYYKGNALTKQGKATEALEAYRMALTLKPRHENILNTIRVHQDFLNVTIMNLTFKPEAVVKQENEKQVKVYISEDNPGIWIPYAMAKAVWVGEAGPGRENPMTWSSHSEREAFLCMLDGYLSLFSQGKIEPVPWLDRLVKIAKAGDLDFYLLYEIGARINPDLVLTFDEETRRQMKNFIVNHVVVDIPK